MTQIPQVALIGAGYRGNAYGDIALKNPHFMKFVAVCDIKPDSVAAFAGKHGIAPENCFSDSITMLNTLKNIDAVVIANLDKDHETVAVAALERKFNVLLEKPMASTVEACQRMAAASERNQRFLMICHVLRYTPFFAKIKELIENRTFGTVQSIRASENIGYYHHSHSYVRGNFRRLEDGSPLILAKCSHDMDILHWLTDETPLRISSFGSLKQFTPENAPQGSAERCLDGCVVEMTCPYSARRIYLGEHTGWPVSMISVDTSLEARTQAIRNGPYGRCVYHSDNTVVDRQIVGIEFTNNITASFEVHAFNKRTERHIHIGGSEGELTGCFEDGSLVIKFFDDRSDITMQIETLAGDHMGGDLRLMEDFAAALRAPFGHEIKTAAKKSVTSHIMALAAEQARVSRKVIELRSL